MMSCEREVQARKEGARIQLHADVIHVFRVFDGELCDVCCLKVRHKVRHLRPPTSSDQPDYVRTEMAGCT